MQKSKQVKGKGPPPAGRPPRGAPKKGRGGAATPARRACTPISEPKGKANAKRKGMPPGREGGGRRDGRDSTAHKGRRGAEAAEAGGGATAPVITTKSGWPRHPTMDVTQPPRPPSRVGEAFPPPPPAAAARRIPFSYARYTSTQTATRKSSSRSSVASSATYSPTLGIPPTRQ